MTKPTFPQVPAQLQPHYKVWSEHPDPYEFRTGPFFYAEPPDVEHPLAAFVAAPHHLNGAGYLHGGMLMSFADFAIFVLAKQAIGAHNVVTLSLQCDFLRAMAPQNDVVYARGDVTRNTRSIVFVRGEIFYDTHILATFSGTLKKLGT